MPSAAITTIQRSSDPWNIGNTFYESDGRGVARIDKVMPDFALYDGGSTRRRLRPRHVVTCRTRPTRRVVVPNRLASGCSRRPPSPPSPSPPPPSPLPPPPPGPRRRSLRRALLRRRRRRRAAGAGRGIQRRDRTPSSISRPRARRRRSAARLPCSLAVIGSSSMATAGLEASKSGGWHVHSGFSAPIRAWWAATTTRRSHRSILGSGCRGPR